MALTGFLINNTCLATSAQALVALQAPFPVVQGTLIINASTATFTAPNTFNLSLATNAVNATTKTATTLKTMVIPMCDPAISIFGGTVFDPVVGASFWSFAMTFILGVFLLSKNAAAIMNAIKHL